MSIQTQEQFRMTEDGVRIAARFFQAAGDHDRLILLAPGFARDKEGRLIVEICEHLTQYGDVICLDFRGVGQSEGRYTFGAKEYLDLKPFLEWGRGHYRQNILMGLSMGSYHSLRAAHDWPELIDQALLVSCPSQLEDVLLKGGPLRQGLALAQDLPALKNRLKHGAMPFFRWGNPFSPKPKGEWLAPGVKVPVSFLVGGKDQLVHPSLSRKVHDSLLGPKSWTEIPEGNHAEFLFLEQNDQFKGWLSQNLKLVQPQRGRTW